MRLFDICVVSFGSYYAGESPDCPWEWRGSGCYDVYVECWQEAAFSVAANSLEEALSLISDNYEKMNREYCNSCDALYYDPDSVVEYPDEEGGDGPEIFECHFNEPVDGENAPLCYSKEVR